MCFSLDHLEKVVDTTVYWDFIGIYLTTIATDRDISFVLKNLGEVELDDWSPTFKHFSHGTSRKNEAERYWILRLGDRRSARYFTKVTRLT